MHAVTHLSSDRDRTWRSAFWKKYTFFFQIFLIYVYVCFVGNVAVSV